MTTRVIFWLSAAFVVYVYVGYPFFLWIAQFLFRESVSKAPIEPAVSLLIPAYNEADVIAAKIRNSLALDYPPDRLEIIVASDGSTDATAQIIRSLIPQKGRVHIRVLEFAENRGKTTALNEAVPHLRGEIVIFSDAASLLGRDSLRKLVANFADERVGAVSGVYKVLNKSYSTLGRQEDFYWKYETFVKTQEAKIGALAGAHGSLYGIRKLLYPFPPSGTINDDFVIPTSVLSRGFRIAYEPEAVACEEAHEMEGFGRRIRIMAGNIQQLGEIKGLSWPPRPLILFCFLSHKGARILIPLAMISLAVSSASLWHEPIYGWFLIGQTLFYGLAVLGAIGWLKPKSLRFPFYFCLINASLFAWLYRILSKRKA